MTLAIRAIALFALTLAGSPSRPEPGSPVMSALREHLQKAERDFLATAEAMPYEKYAFKPTPANMTFGQHLVHMGDFNENMCALISGTKAPDHGKLPATAPKAKIIEHLRESFTFCGTVLAKLDDSGLADKVPFYGSEISRASAVLILSGDWYDHYAVAATYLRLNGLLPPTARS
jgi:hypothetical protein